MGENKKQLSRQTLRCMAATEAKSKVLGINFHKARRILINTIVKKYFELRGWDNCYRCHKKITGDYHLDHIEPWLGSFDPVSAFFNVEHIRISHPICNSLARRQNHSRSPEFSEIMKKVAHKERDAYGRFKKSQKS